MEVKPEYAQHIYPDMKFSQSICNPCDETCNIEVKKQQIEKMLEPVETRSTILDSIKAVLPDSGIPFFGTGKEQASLL